MKKVLCIFLCTVFLFTGMVVAFGDNTQVNGCNWMSVIRDDTCIADISMPGTHDTAATYVAFGIKARCQDKTIPEQLNCGARFLDIRLSKDGSQLQLVHNFLACHKGSGFTAPVLYFNDAIDYCIDFLKANPKECIVMFVKKDSGSSDGFDTLMMQYITDTLDYWYTKNRVPDLGEVRGKIVLMNRFSESTSSLNDQNGGVNLTNFPSQKDNVGSFQAVSLDMFGGPMISTYMVQDRYSYPKEEKWEKAIVPSLGMNKIGGQLFLCFCSTANGISPEINAKYINAKVLEYAFERSKCYGAVLFDFIDEELARTVYLCNEAVIDQSLTPAAGVPSEVPAPQHGFIRFLDGFWNFLIGLFSK